MFRYIWRHILKLRKKKKVVAMVAVVSVLSVFTLSLFTFKDQSTLVTNTQGAVLFLTQPITRGFSNTLSFFVDIAGNIKNIFNAKSENAYLRKRNIELEKYFLRAKVLEYENMDLKNKLSYIKENEIKFKTARLIGNVINQSVKELFIEVGDASDIKEDSLVFNEKGAIGRVINVGPLYAKTLLLNDKRSNIPARAVESGIKMIVSGTGGNDLIIKFVSEEKAIKVGEIILTSGEEHLVPDNIAIGYVVGFDGEHYLVRPFNNLANINFAFIYLK
jgi:rod shape-determining protein MreC